MGAGESWLTCAPFFPIAEFMSVAVNTTVFLSYARADDGEPFDPATSFVARLHRDLTKAGFDVWFDRVSMPSRTLTFHQEIRDAIAARERLVLIVGPKAATSEYVQQEWKFAWREADKVVTPILRWGDYPLVPDELKLLHCEDFRDDSQYPFHLENLVRQLREPPPPLGKLIAVPSLPAHYLTRAERLQALRDALRADLDRPVVIGGAATRVGVHGMGGIGKSVLAAALARDRRVREAFPDGIVWAGLGQSPDLLALMQRVHRELGGDGAITSEHEGKQRLKELLADKAVLLVLDDAWRRSDVDAFDVLGPRCRALVTTRDAGLLTALGGTHHVVELLTDEEARRLLATAAGVTDGDLPQEATALIAECGRLPLAVALCGALVRRQMPWKSVLDQLEQARIDRIADRHAVEPQHQSIWQAIHVSVEALEPPERERFLELAVFPTDETIPELGIAVLWEHTGQLGGWSTAEILTTLAERSLIQMTLSTAESSGGGRRFSLHDLVYAYVTRAIPDAKQLHATLLAAYARKCPAGWASGPNDGYFYQSVLRHALLARDLNCTTALIVNGFLDRKAELLGDPNALLDARLAAEALASAGPRHSEELITCANKYCALAQRIRNVPQAIEKYVRRGDVDSIVHAIEAETDTFRKGTLLLASGALLRDAGHSMAETFLERAEMLHDLLPNQTDVVSSHFTYETVSIVRALIATTTGTTVNKQVGSAVTTRSGANRTTIREAHTPREWVPLLYAALVFVGGRQRTIFSVGAFGWIGILVSLLLLWAPAQSREQGSSTFTFLFTMAYLGPVVVLLCLFAIEALLLRYTKVAMQCVTDELLAECRLRKGAKRKGVVLRALRWHHLLAGLEGIPWRIDLSNNPQLSQLAVQEFDQELDAGAAACWLFSTAELEPEVCEVLLDRLRQMPQEWSADVLRELILLVSGWRMREPVMRFAVALAERADDPEQLLGLMAIIDPEGRNELAWDSDTEAKKSPRIDPVRVLTSCSAPFLARSAIAGLCRKKTRLRNPIVESLRSVVFGVRARSLGTPVCRRETLCLAILFLLPAVGSFFLLSLLYAGIGVLVITTRIAAPLFFRLHDPYDVRHVLALTSDRQCRRKILEQIERHVSWLAFPSRTFVSTIVAQSILRDDQFDLSALPAAVIRRSLALLSRRGLLAGLGPVVLHTMKSRPLLASVSSMRRRISKSIGKKTVDLTKDRQQLCSVLPLESAWRNFGLVSGLSLVLTILTCAGLILLPARMPDSLAVGLAAMGWLIVGNGLAALQHLRVARDSRDSVEHSVENTFLRLVLVGTACLAVFFIAVGLEWLINTSVIAETQIREFVEQRRLSYWSSVLWLQIVSPLLVVNVIVPELIARWRGIGLLYPNKGRLLLRRFGCTLFAIVISLTFALISWCVTSYLP